MSPSERPSNDNEGAPILWENTPLGKRVFAVVSAVVLIGGAAFMIAVLDAAHWRAFGITLGIAVVGMIVAAIYRLIVYGRA